MPNKHDEMSNIDSPNTRIDSPNTRCLGITSLHPLMSVAKLSVARSGRPRSQTCTLNPSRTHRVCRALPRCSAETQKLFAKRLEALGWERPRRHDGLHPLVAETWAAMDQVYGAGVLETPLEPAPWLRVAAGGGEGSVSLKMETQQVTGSFKARGAAHKLLSLTADQLQRGVVTSSTGNHALAVLHACTALGAAGRHVAATVYVPSTLAPQKAAKLQAAAAKAGARVIIHGTDCVEAEREARREAGLSDKVFISPYNDAAVAGGQGTLAVELLMALPPERLDAVFVPVGGGGLVAGVAALLKSMHPAVHIFGCQPERSDVMRRSVEAGRIVELPRRVTLSEGTAGGVEESAMTLEACSQFVDEWVVVEEEDIAAAMVAVHGHHGVMIEGAAGVAVAAFQKRAAQLARRHVVIVCCGGNVSQEAVDAAYSMVKSRSSMGGSVDMG